MLVLLREDTREVYCSERTIVEGRAACLALGMGGRLTITVGGSGRQLRSLGAWAGLDVGDTANGQRTSDPRRRRERRRYSPVSVLCRDVCRCPLPAERREQFTYRSAAFPGVACPYTITRAQYVQRLPTRAGRTMMAAQPMAPAPARGDPLAFALTPVAAATPTPNI